MFDKADVKGLKAIVIAVMGLGWSGEGRLEMGLHVCMRLLSGPGKCFKWTVVMAVGYGTAPQMH